MCVINHLLDLFTLSYHQIPSLSPTLPIIGLSLPAFLQQWESETVAEEITCLLLAEDRPRTEEEIRGDEDCAVDRNVKLDEDASYVTGVLLFSTFTAVCGSLNYGLAVGYSSPAQSEIMDDLDLSTAEYSLFGTLLTIGGSVGAIACGKMSDYLGRRGTFGVTDVFSIGGWLATVVSQGALSLYLGRLLLGFALGLSTYVVPIYVAEISPRKHRGGLLMMCTGLGIAFILGVFIPWRVLAAIGTIPNISQLIGLFFIPESPRWLAKFDKKKEFEAALRRLRGAVADISEEAADIKEYTQAFKHAPKVILFQLFQRKYAHALTVGVGLLALSQLDGLIGILCYADSIFESAGLSSKLGSVTMAIILMASALVSLLLADKRGRRPLLMVSASGLCLACALAGISFLLQDHGWLQGFSPYLSLTGILMHSAFYSVGMSGIPFLIISEIYPTNVKGLAGSIAILAAWVTSGLVTYAFNFSMEWSAAGTFFILAGICGLTALFVVKIVPETKGRKLEEIQASMDRTFHSVGDQAWW